MIRHIVAFDTKRGIAKDGVQPWKIPDDEQYFSAMTKRYGGIVLMGRTTFEVIGEPLVDRKNFVLTRDPNYQAGGATIVHDLPAFLRSHDDVWVIGGAQLYAATIDVADELYITHIDADLQCDVFYPEFSHDFVLASEMTEQTDNGYRYWYATYRTKRL